MQASIRDRRIEQEWRLLVELAERNPDSVERPEKVEIGGGPAFQVTFHGVEAITDLDGGDANGRGVAHGWTPGVRDSGRRSSPECLPGGRSRQGSPEPHPPE